jgi:hypothetical protein
MTSSQSQADVAATSTQHHSANSTQQPRSGNRTLIPVYVLPENLCRVQQYVLSLGQPIFSGPTVDYCPSSSLQPEEVNALNSPEINSSEQRSNIQELISGVSTLSVSTPSSYVSSISPVSSSHHPTLAFVSISNIPFSPSATKGNRYYTVLIGKKTGVFWDKW